MNASAKTNATVTESQSVHRQLDLADPDDRPNSVVVIFDGECRFCQKQVRRLKAFDSGNRLSFISLHDPRVHERYPELTHDQLMDQMYAITADGSRYGGAGAVRYLSRHLPRLWWLAPVMHIPFSLPLWQWLYNRVAIRRYKLSEKMGDACDDACSIHLNK